MVTPAIKTSYDHLRRVILGWSRTIGDKSFDVARRCTTSQSWGPISRCFGSFWSCSKTCCDSRSCGISKDDRAMSYDVMYDIVRHRGSSHDICAIDVRWRHTTSSMIVWRQNNQYRIVRHRMTVIRSSYDHRATSIYKTILASHHTIIVKSYVIVRLSYDYRTTIIRLSFDDVVRFTYALASHQAIIVKSYVIVRLSFDCHTMSCDVVRCNTM